MPDLIKDKDENARLNLIHELNVVLDIAKQVFNNTNFSFKKHTYYGGIWLEVMDLLTNPEVELTEDITRKLFKVFIPFQSVQRLKGVRAYFDRSTDAWSEKVRNLFESKDEETFDSNCYEFYIGSNLYIENKEIFFCNMENKGESESPSLCEYILEDRLFIECKNLFGINKNAINNNLRKANKQLRSTMDQISSNKPLGIVFLDLPERLNIDNRQEIIDKLREALIRLKQCDSTHFLGITFMNIVTNEKDSSAISFSRLIANPKFKQEILQDKEGLMLLYPKFRMVLFPDDNCQTFDVWDFILNQTKQQINFDKLFNL